MVFKKRDKLLFLFIVFLFVLSVPVSANKVLKDAWFEHDSTFVVGTDIFNVFLFPSDDNMLRFKYNDDVVVIKLYGCVLYSNYEFCYVNKSYEQKITIYDGKLKPGIKVKITSMESIFDIRFSSSESGNKFLFEEYLAVIKLENMKDMSVSDVELIITVPENVSIVDNGGFTISGNKLKRSVSFSSIDERLLEFRYEVLSEDTKKFDYVIVKDGVELRKGSFSVKGILPYEISITAPVKSDIRVIQTAVFKIKNIHSLNRLEVSNFEISGPLSFQYLSNQGLDTQKHGLFQTSSFYLEPGSEKTFQIRYRPMFVGSYSYKLSGLFELLGVYEVEQKNEMEIISEGFTPEIKFTKKDIAVGSDNNLVIQLINNHKSLSFKNIEVVLTSELLNKTFNHSFLGSGQSVKLLDEKFIINNVLENTKYEASLIVNYVDDSGISNKMNLSDSFNVFVEGNILRINQKVSSRRVKAGDEVVVEIFIKNLMDNDFKEIFVEDVFSQRVDLVAGKTSSSMVLNGNQESQSYLYKFTVPQRPTNNRLEINTSAFIPQFNYTVSAKSFITVDGEIFEEDEDPNMSDEDDGQDDGQDENLGDDQQNTGEKSDLDKGADSEKKDGFLRRLVKSFENFFSGLFSSN